MKKAHCKTKLARALETVTFEQALQGGAEEAAIYLRSQHIMHPKLATVIDEVRKNMIPSAGLSMTALVGMTGAGKSTFAKLTVRELLKRYEALIRENPGVIPVVLSEVAAADEGTMNWKLFYKHLCQDMLAYGSGVRIEGAEQLKGRADTIRSRRMLFEDALECRGVRHLILDEAVHFTDSDTQSLHYGNLLKSLANRERLNLLMVGAFGSEKLLEASDQIARRLGVVHFPRYYQNDEDLQQFATYVKSFAACFPLPFPVDLAGYAEELFYAHFGAIGYVSNTLIRAVGLCKDSGQHEWKDEYLTACMPTEAQFDKIAVTTLEGEKALERYLVTRKRRRYPTSDEMLGRLESRTPPRSKVRYHGPSQRRSEGPSEGMNA